MVKDIGPRSQAQLILSSGSVIIVRQITCRSKGIPITSNLWNANTYTAREGIIVADTKFKFGLGESTTPPAAMLIDQVLTLGDSRFANADKCEVGYGQEPLDEQNLRLNAWTVPNRAIIDRTSLRLCLVWLIRNGLKRKEGVKMLNEVVSNVLNRYKETYHSLTGRRYYMATEER